MSAFHGPQEHLANPPATWQVLKAADRNWQLCTKDGIPLESGQPTRRQAEADRESGPLARLYDNETRWYAGQSVTHWAPYVPETVADAHACGQLAHGIDMPRVPPGHWFNDGPVGTTDLGLIVAWTAGWDAANLTVKV